MGHHSARPSAVDTHQRPGAGLALFMEENSAVIVKNKRGPASGTRHEGGAGLSGVIMATSDIEGGSRLQRDRSCRQDRLGRKQKRCMQHGWHTLRYGPDPHCKRAGLAVAVLCLFTGMATCAAALHSRHSLGPPLLQQAAHGDRQALQRIRHAAAQGNAQAETDLGILYAHGDGVPQNYTRAFSWYRKAAAQGNATARHDLAALRRRLRREMYR